MIFFFFFFTLPLTILTHQFRLCVCVCVCVCLFVFTRLTLTLLSHRSLRYLKLCPVLYFLHMSSNCNASRDCRKFWTQNKLSFLFLPSFITLFFFLVFFYYYYYFFYFLYIFSIRLRSISDLFYLFKKLKKIKK